MAGHPRHHLTIAVIVLVVGLCSLYPVRAASCSLVKYESFDISPSPGNVVTIPVSINNGSAKFLVDTGGMISTITPSLVESLHLDTSRFLSQRIKFYAADGSTLNRFTTIDSLGIGPVSVPHVKLLLQPKNTRIGFEDFQGTLAPDLLRNFDLDFDVANKTFNLFSPDHCPGQVVYWSVSYAAIPFKTPDLSDHIEVPVTLDGHDFIALLDTGASLTTLSAKIAHQVFGLDMKSPGMERIPAASQQSLLQYRYRFKSLNLQSVAVHNPLIAILPDDAENAFKWNSNEQKADGDPVYGINLSSPRVILGMDILSQLHFYIAYGEKTLYVTAADAGRAPQAPAVPSTAAK